MSFKSSEDWAEKLVTLYRNANSIEDDERLYELLDALFNLSRHLISAENCRSLRSSAFTEWNRAVAQ